MTDLFKDKAGDWDSRPAPKIISESVGAAILEAIEWRPSMRAMDFGAGTGLVSSHVAPRVEKLWAVDVSGAMLEQLSNKAELDGKVETVCRDIVAEPLAMTFDLIVSAMALHHVADTQALLERFRDNLEPGGQLALADLDAEDGTFHAPETSGVFHLGFDRTELQRQLEAAGFESCRFETAVEVPKNERSYPIFLVTATRA